MRLKSHIWVSAYLRRLDAAFIPAAVVRRGDADAGAVYIKISHLDGTCQILAPLSAHSAQGLPTETVIIDEARAWQTIYSPSSMEADADGYLRRQAARDPDIWVLEVESADGRHLLGEASLAMS